MTKLIGAGYVGDFAQGAPVFLPFCVQDGGGAVPVRGPLGATAIRLSDGQDTQIGVSVVDDVGGSAVVRIDAAAGVPDGMYLAGTDWAVVLEAGTAGGLPLFGLLVGHFSVANRS